MPRRTVAQHEAPNCTEQDTASAVAVVGVEATDSLEDLEAGLAALDSTLSADGSRLPQQSIVESYLAETAAAPSPKAGSTSKPKRTRKPRAQSASKAPAPQRKATRKTKKAK